MLLLFLFWRYYGRNGIICMILFVFKYSYYFQHYEFGTTVISILLKRKVWSREFQRLTLGHKAWQWCYWTDCLPSETSFIVPHYIHWRTISSQFHTRLTELQRPVNSSDDFSLSLSFSNQKFSAPSRCITATVCNLVYYNFLFIFFIF